MPLYEYLCDACGRQFEVIRKFSDPPLDKCPTCGGPVQKLMSSPAFQFKGSGWYITDYAQKGKSGGESSGSDAPAEKKSDSTKADTSTKSDAATSSTSASTTTSKD
jgi:putative FmdB family regulatory protein